MIYTEASPGRIAATPTSIPASTRTRCLACKRPTSRANDLHWQHEDGTDECLIFVTDRKNALRFTRDGHIKTWIGIVHPLASRLAEKPDVTISRWAGERLVLAPGNELDPIAARVDYLAWASDQPGARPEARGKMRAAIRAAGGTPRGLRDKLRYHDLALVSDHLPAPVLLAALTAIKDAGLITDRDALNRAYRELR